VTGKGASSTWAQAVYAIFTIIPKNLVCRSLAVVTVTYMLRNLKEFGKLLLPLHGTHQFNPTRLIDLLVCLYKRKICDSTWLIQCNFRNGDACSMHTAG